MSTGNIKQNKKILHLHLRKEYFDAIAAGEKIVEYRRVSDYWCQRLIPIEYDEIWLYNGYPKMGDNSKIIKRRWNGMIREKIVHKEFGSKPVEVFCIDLSQKVQIDIG